MLFTLFVSGVLMLYITFIIISEPTGNIFNLLLEDPICKILVFVTQEFKVKVSVCGYHFYKPRQIFEKHF